MISNAGIFLDFAWMHLDMMTIPAVVSINYSYRFISFLRLSALMAAAMFLASPVNAGASAHNDFFSVTTRSQTFLHSNLRAKICIHVCDIYEFENFSQFCNPPNSSLSFSSKSLPTNNYNTECEL